MKFKTQLMDEAALNRAIIRLSHEIIEKNDGVDDIVLVGIKTRGVPFAKRVAANIYSLEGKMIKVENLDITLYRDDLSELAEFPKISSDSITSDIKNKKIILCDDVLYTGRTARAAIEAIIKHGRPKCIQLAIVVDRGHRELPIRADYVGKNVPTSKDEVITVKFKETDGEDKVDIYQQD